MAAARILIADDEPYVRRTLRRVLGNYEVVLVADGREAIAALEGDDTFDVILCDLMMPIVNGMEVYDHLSKTSPGLEKRMVFLTGGTYDEAGDEFLSRVSNPVLEKPFNFQKLRSIIEQMVAQGASLSG